MNTTVKLAIISTILTLTRSEHEYFEYEDCDKICILNNSSCTIAELSNDFVKTCYEKDVTCEDEVNELVVCLRIGKPPIGGELIWEDYKRRYYPTTTTTRPPIPTDNTHCLTWKVTSITMISCLALIILIIVSRYTYKRFRGSRYDSPLIESTEDNPYQVTTEPRNDEE